MALTPLTPEETVIIDRLKALIVAADVAMDPKSVRELCVAWEDAEATFGITPTSPDRMNMYFDNRELDLVEAAFNTVP